MNFIFAFTNCFYNPVRASAFTVSVDQDVPEVHSLEKKILATISHRGTSCFRCPGPAAKLTFSTGFPCKANQQTIDNPRHRRHPRSAQASDAGRVTRRL
jgi:hypothetical protein